MKTIDLVSIRKWLFLASGLTAVLGLILLAIPPTLKPGIEFTSGSSMLIRFTNPVSQSDLRDEFSKLGHPEARIQSTGASEFLIRTKSLNVPAGSFNEGEATPAATPAATATPEIGIGTAIIGREGASGEIALRAVQGGGEICDDARCQVYVGAGAETAGQNAAVAATARKVIVHGGALAAAVYSADAGGVSATTAEGFGTPDGVYPYLTTVRYDTDNPLPWRREVGLPDLGARMRYPGTLTGVRIAEKGPSDRALSVVLEGSAGERRVDGRQFARSLGLRSTRFTVSMGSAAAAPAPLPAAPEEEIQALPDEADEMALRPQARAGDLTLDRRSGPWDAGAPGPGLPEALDPRRHPATLVAILLAAGVAGGLVPTWVARGPSPVRALASWSTRSRRH